MDHYPVCEKATSRTCVCQMCCGSLHGWTGAVKLARRPARSGRNTLRRKAERDWRAAFTGKTRKRPSFKKKSAGIDLCQVEIIDFLAVDNSATRDKAAREPATTSLVASLPADSADDKLWEPDPDSMNSALAAQLRNLTRGDGPRVGDALADKVEVVAKCVIGGVLDDIAQTFSGGIIPAKVKVALADHFWCDLLAQLAHAIDIGLKHVDSVPDRVAGWVMKSREQSRWRHLEYKVVRTAARSVWNKVKLVAAFGVLNRPIVLPVIRVLAILMCKAPERHKAVVEYCVDPLGNRIFAAIKERLLAVLSDWLPRMRKSLGQDGV